MRSWSRWTDIWTCSLESRVPPGSFPSCLICPVVSVCVWPRRVMAPLPAVTFPAAAPGPYWLSCSEGWRLTCGIIGRQQPLCVCLSLYRKLTWKPVMMSVFRCERWDCWSWTGPVLAAHQAARCYPGWLTNESVCVIRSARFPIQTAWGSPGWGTCRSLGQSGTVLRSVMERGAQLTLCWSLRCGKVMESVVLWRVRSVLLISLWWNLIVFFWRFGFIDLHCMNIDDECP